MTEYKNDISINGHKVYLVVFYDDKQEIEFNKILISIEKDPEASKWRTILYSNHISTLDKDLKGLRQVIIKEFSEFILRCAERCIRKISDAIVAPLIIKIELNSEVHYRFAMDYREVDYAKIGVQFSIDNILQFVHKNEDHFISGLSHEMNHFFDPYTMLEADKKNRFENHQDLPFIFSHFITILRSEALTKFGDIYNYESNVTNGAYHINTVTLHDYKGILKNLHKQYWTLSAQGVKGVGDMFEGLTQLTYFSCHLIPFFIGYAKLVERNIQFEIIIDNKKIPFNSSYFSSNLDRYLSKFTKFEISRLPLTIFNEVYAELMNMDHVHMIEAYDTACRILKISDKNKIISIKDYETIHHKCLKEFMDKI